MIKSMRIVGKIPNDVYLACSGGMDSMVARHFLSNNGRHVTCLYFHHGTKHADIARSFLEGLVGPNLRVGYIQGQVPKGRSKEDFWREQRYQFLNQFADKRVVTCHHLDDQIETFLQGIAHGRCGRGIKHTWGNYLRPFLRVPRSVIAAYAHRHSIAYVQDPSNMDNSYTRNRVRNMIIPELCKVNPGLYKCMDNLFAHRYTS